MKVIVVDDDKGLLDAYKYYIGSFDEYNLVGAYTNVYDALEEFDALQPDIIISDISMPLMNGVDGIKLFRKKDPKVKIIMISVHDDYTYISGAFENMVNGYLTKPINKNTLLDALSSVKNDNAKISDNVAQTIINSFRRKNFEMFSERENEIIHLLQQGNTYKAISEKLFISTSTVNFHLQNIYLKLNVNSKSEALDKLREMNNS